MDCSISVCDDCINIRHNSSLAPIAFKYSWSPRRCFESASIYRYGRILSLHLQHRNLSSATNIMDSSNTGFAAQIRCLKGAAPERKACRAACTVDTCPMVLSYWGYRPSIPENGTFAVFMGIFTLAILGIGIWTRRFKKYTAMVFIGSAMEVLGFIARIYAYSYPFSDVRYT